MYGANGIAIILEKTTVDIRYKVSLTGCLHMRIQLTLLHQYQPPGQIEIPQG